MACHHSDIQYFIKILLFIKQCAQSQIPITLPDGVELSGNISNPASVKISSDGLNIFFIGYDSTANLYSIYACDISGSNLQEIVALDNGEWIEIGGVN